MTPEETQRNIDFIIASLARLTAAEETHDRLFQQMAKTQRQMSDLLVNQSQLLVHQSERMDRFDRVHEELSSDIKHLLNMILDRLPPRIR
jgi:hypothetical protein